MAQHQSLADKLRAATDAFVRDFISAVHAATLAELVELQRAPARAPEPVATPRAKATPPCPKAKAASGSCSVCGRRGHNARTCKARRAERPKVTGPKVSLLSGRRPSREEE